MGIGRGDRDSAVEREVSGDSQGGEVRGRVEIDRREWEEGRGPDTDGDPLATRDCRREGEPRKGGEGRQEGEGDEGVRDMGLLEEDEGGV